MAREDRPEFVRELMKEEVETIAGERPAIDGDIDSRIVEGLAGVLDDAAEGEDHGNQSPA